MTCTEEILLVQVLPRVWFFELLELTLVQSKESSKLLKSGSYQYGNFLLDFRESSILYQISQVCSQCEWFV